MTVAAQQTHVCPPDRVPLPYIVVIANTDRSRVIVQHNDDGKLCFPRLECPELPFYGQKVCECISKRFEEKCGTRYELVLLYSTINDHFNDHIRPIFSAFHCLSPNDNNTDIPVAPASEKYEWMTTSEVDKQLGIIGKDNCRWIHSMKDFESFCFMMRDTEYKRYDDEFGCRPWELPGWLINTSNAATAALGKLGYEVQGNFEQFQVTHGTAAVLRANTNKGRVYLKASNGIEGNVTTVVAGFAPHLVRKPIFVNKENQWMLMNDQGEPIGCNTRRQDFCKLLIEYGNLQLQSLNHIEALKDAGLPVQTLESVIRQTKSLLSDKGLLDRLGKLNEFQTRERGALPDIGLHSAALYKLIHELYEKGKCPLALRHGDITENVLKDHKGSLVLFDWGAAKIDIPLLDTFCFTDSVTSQVMDEYLTLWEKYAPAPELRQLLEIGSIVVPLVSMFDMFCGEHWVLGDEDARVIANSLVRAKTTAEQRDLISC